MQKISRSLGATSKFQVPECWHDASSIFWDANIRWLRTKRSHLNFMFFFYLTWCMEFLYPWYRLTCAGSRCWLPWVFVSILQIVWCRWRCSDGICCRICYEEEIMPVCFWYGVAQEFGSGMSFLYLDIVAVTKLVCWCSMRITHDSMQIVRNLM